MNRQSDPHSSANPYASPRSSASGAFDGAARAARDPIFCELVFLIDLLFVGCLRLPYVVDSLAAWVRSGTNAAQNPLVEFITLLTMLVAALLGLTATTAMLAGRRWGVTIAYLAAGAVLVNVGMEAWSGIMGFGQAGPRIAHGADFAGVHILASRLVMLVVYLVAVLRFRRSCDRRATTARR